MDKTPHHLREPGKYIRGLEKTNEFLGLLNQGKERPVALGHVAAMFAERMSQPEEQTIEQLLDRSAVHILSLLPGFIEAQRALDSLEQRDSRHHLSKNEKLSHKQTATAFNHALRELIDLAPDIQASEVRDFIFKAALEMGHVDTAKYTAQETQAVLHGIQHEIGFEQILWQLEDVEDVVHSDEKQELIGIDLIVRYKNKQIPVDVKASELSARKSLQAHETYMRNHHLSETNDKGGYPVWTGLETSDFGGGFRIPEELAAQKASRVATVLDRLYERNAQTA